MSTNSNKKEKMFSPKAVIEEIKKVTWPKKKDLLSNSVQVIIVMGFFALFFYLCQFVISVLLNLVGGR